MNLPHHELQDPDQLKALLDAVMSVESGTELGGLLRRITEAACRLTSARYGALGVVDAERGGLAEFIHVGIDEATATSIGHLPEGKGILGLLIRDDRPLRLRDLTAHPEAVGFPRHHPAMRSFLGVPLRVGDAVFGNIYLTNKNDAEEFSANDEALVVALAAAAGMAIDKVRMHARLDELARASDRERIARDLHDTVIQQLFATGLSLQFALPLAHDEELHRRIEDAIAELDDTIRQVRSTIFALEPPPAIGRNLRVRVIEICAEAARALGFEPTLRFHGAVARGAQARVAVELLSALREALANVARHAQARHVDVEISLGKDLRLRVADDGVGPSKRRSGGRGVANMAERAALLGGSFALLARPEGGTEVDWRVPLSS